MSLLMDALRKAEESKKKVASKAPSESESSARQSPRPATPPAMPGKSATSAPAPDKATSRDVPPDETGPAAAPNESRKPAPRQPIPDLAMEFDEAEAGSPSPVPATSKPTTNSADGAGDAATQTSKENPAKTADNWQSGTSRESMDIPRETADQDSAVQSSAKPDAAQFELTPKEQTDSRQPLDTGAEPDYPAIPSVVDKQVDKQDDKPGEKPDVSPTVSPTGAKPKPALALEVESPELPAVQTEPSVSDPGKSRATPGPAPQGTQQRTGSSIRERSAGRRASARSVFTAKKPQQQKRRQQLMVAGGGVMTVLLLGLGTVYYLNSGSSSGITVPDNYVASQDFSSGEVDRGDDAVTADAGGVAQQDAGLNEPVVSADEINQPQVVSSSAADDAVATPVIIPPLEPPIATATSDTTPVSSAATTAATTTSAPTGRAPAAPDTALTEPVPAGSSVTDSTTSTVVGAEPATADATESGVAASPDTGGADVTGSPANNPGSQSPASAEVAAGNAPSRATGVISFSRRQPESAIEPQLNRAYAAFQQGDFSQARALYESVLIESPLHRDALLGLAAIAVENRQPAQAMEYYSRLLARNPNDPVARTALLELSPAGGPAVQERELRRLQERHPGVAPLAYSMGNFYASRQQWTDAQQHYFRALQLAKSAARESSEVNPDYAFNLAVSLEHLNQRPAALSFYREALEQSERFPASFDIALVRNRIDSLSRTLTP